jgi:hypothetical protein
MSMKTLRKLVRGLAVVLVVASLVPSMACLGGIRQAAQRQQDANEMKMIALDYHGYIEDNKKPPDTRDELVAHLGKIGGANSPVITALTTGKYVFYLGVNVAKLPDSGNTVLGYEAAVPTSGGQVVMADGSVRQMTADEFAKATKPPNPKLSYP